MFDTQNIILKILVVPYKVEFISNPCIITIAVNPKEYFKQFKNRLRVRNWVGVRNNALGMHFYHCVSRTFSLNEQQELQNKTSANQIQKCFEKQQNEYDQSEDTKACTIA